MTVTKPISQTQPKPRRGRPRLHKVRRQVKLTPAADEYLRQLGEGQLSNGIERAAEQSRASNGLPSVAAHLRMLEERGVLQQRATQVFAGKRLSAVKVDGQPVSDMLIKERR